MFKKNLGNYALLKTVTIPHQFKMVGWVGIFDTLAIAAGTTVQVTTVTDNGEFDALFNFSNGHSILGSKRNIAKLLACCAIKKI